jgi:hypothetical protein
MKKQGIPWKKQVYARTSSVELHQPATKGKYEQMGIHKIKKLLHNKRNGL